MKWTFFHKISTNSIGSNTTKKVSILLPQPFPPKTDQTVQLHAIAEVAVFCVERDCIDVPNAKLEGDWQFDAAT